MDDIEVVKEINRTDSEWRQLLGESKYSVLRKREPREPLLATT